MSLPGVFSTTLETVPCELPYLKAGQEAAVERTALLKGDALNVGIVWQGSLTNDRALYRSSSLTDFAFLRHVDGVSIFSVQSQLSASDAALLKEYSIPDLETGLTDFADTAAIVQKLDLVITVDTAMAHLAGALGREVWVLVPQFADWRWMLARNDSPWYPGMRLFRQARIGDWRPVVEEVAAVLERRGAVATRC